MQYRRLFAVTLAFAAAVPACRKGEAHSSRPSSSVASNAEPSSVATTHSAELTVNTAMAEPGHGKIETVDVASDRAALVVVGEGDKARRPIVHIHGMCAEANSDLEAWSSSVRAYGTIVALEGDAACNGRGGRTWSMDAAALDRRIDKALEAVRSVRGVDLDTKEIVLIGESMGASRAEALAALAPDKYTRLVLVGAPEKVSPQNVANAKAIAIVVGEKEPQEDARRSLEALTAAGETAKLWTLSGAIHGEYGPNGAATMGEALAFATQR